MGKGGQQQQQPQPTSSTVTQSNIPEYARPYFENLLQRAQATSEQPYTPYTEQRIADLAPQTTKAISNISASQGIATPYINAAGGALGNASASINNAAGYQAPTIESQYQASPITSSYQPGQIGSNYTPGIISSTYQAPNIQNTYNAGNISSQYQAGSYTPTSGIMQPAQMWNQQQAQQYMSPYQQSVTDVAKREAARQSAIGGLGEQAQATQAGGYGGYRHGLVEAERARNLSQLQNQIQVQGDQAAYNQAAQQFGADRAAQLAAAQAAQNASQFQYGATQQAQQTQGAQSLQAQLAAEQARQTQGGMSLQAQQAMAQALQAQGAQSLQAQQATEQARQTGGAQYLQGQQLAEQAGQAAGAQGIQAQQATQQALQNQGLQSLQAQQANAQAQQQAANLWLGAGQAGLGLAQGLGSLGTTAQKAGAFDTSQLLTAGNIQQQAQQAQLNQKYQDFLSQQYYPMQQEQFLSSILRGQVIQPSTLQATYQQPYDPVSQALALGIGGAGLARAFG
jgi:hypothetical protein